MERGAKLAKAKVEGPSVRSKSSNKGQLEQRLTEAVEQQAATSEILRAISSSPTELDPVFRMIIANAIRLCSASVATLWLFDGEVLTSVANHNASPDFADYLSSARLRPGNETTTRRAALERKTIHLADLLGAHGYAPPDFQRKEQVRTVLSVPLLRESVLVGVITLWRREIKPFTDSQVALVETFASQAVIAIENVRLLNETKEALEQQTATSEILRVISQSQTDVQPVFDTIVSAALRLCSASSSMVFTFDGELIHLVAREPGAVGARSHYPTPPSRDTAAARTVLTGRIVTIPDVLEDPEYVVPDIAVTAGFRSVVSVPLIRDTRPIGAIAVGKPEPGPFPEEQIALLQTFAAQAVIAIENVRLFKELQARNRDLTEALERQTATSEVLEAISSAQTDASPVFETIARNAQRLSGAVRCNVLRYDGRLLHIAACSGFSTEDEQQLRKRYPVQPGEASVMSGRVILSGMVEQIDDALRDPLYDQEHAVTLGLRRMLGVPMLRGGAVLGVIVLAWREAGQTPAVLIDLLKIFADQAVIAIENVRLFTELEARTTQLTQSVGELKALGEVGQAVSSTLDLETVLSTIVSRATQLAGMDAGAIYEYDEVREEFYLRAVDQYADDLVEALHARPIRKGEGALGRLAVVAEPVQVLNIMDEKVYQSGVRKMLIRLGYRSLLSVPLLREDRLIGGLVVNRKAVGEFAPQVIELLKTFATQSALAIQNARLFREIEEKSQQLEVASQHKSEFLANMSHELRTPLNAIIGFSEVLSERMFGEINEKQAEYIGDILESGQHLLSLINDILDLSKIEAGRMELELNDFDLPNTIENTLTLVRERAMRRGIELGRRVDERLGVVHADERKVKQVLLNLLSNALKFTPEGGRIDVRATVLDSTAEISVADTGVGIAPEDQATVFEEFRQVGSAAKRSKGPALASPFRGSSSNFTAEESGSRVR